ncbi:hypothetical protein G4B84_006500 [Aspergillus flavus NRRL3357]|nr:uncharacterized protein G4B84_006500 [Aspergillus flavus NRRL3357]QMW31119.1 hypothetical protein G4B84_006500 [Aspergillus flavus NRRL3357]
MAAVTTPIMQALIGVQMKIKPRRACKSGIFFSQLTHTRANLHRHEVYRLLLSGRLYLAPIADKPQNVLYVGTGTGLWAIDFGDMHPSAKVIGTDLSPIQPSFTPPNVQFEVDDCCDPWLYKNDTFDFVHVRGLYGCVSDWDEFYTKAYKHIKPGEYIEQLEQSVQGKSDDGTTNGSMHNEWAQHFLKADDT